MTLREALEVAKGKEIRLGSGSSFIFIGKVENDTIEEIDGMSDEEKERLRQAREKNKHHRDTFDNFWVNTSKKRLNAVVNDSKLDKVLENIQKELDKIKTDKQRDWDLTLDNIETYSMKIAQWVPYLDREIRDAYNSVENDDLIILFEGDEGGKYWFKSEYEADKKRKKHEKQIQDPVAY